jgi:lipopolysaccharide export system protein LptC
MTKKSYQPGWRSSKSRGNPSKKPGFISKHLKLILLTAIIVVLGAIFLWPKVEKLLVTEKKGPKNIERVLKENPLLENKVINPILNSLDKNGRPYRIIAKYALDLNAKRSEFIEPSGQLQLADGSTMFYVGDRAFYHKEEDMLEFFDNVKIKTDKGYDLKTSYMKLFVNEGTGEGDKPVKGIGPNGETIVAEGFKLTDKGDIIEFLGKTQISLPGKK